MVRKLYPCELITSIDNQDVHDHQLFFNNWMSLRMLQWIGLRFDLFTIFQTVLINILLLYGIANPGQGFDTDYAWLNVIIDQGSWVHVFTSSVKVRRGI